MEELGKDGFLPKSFTTPPVDPTTNTEPTPPASAPQTEPMAQTTQGTAAPAQPAKGSEPIPDKFFEDFNKRYGTSFKGDDELKPIFELPKKVTEYEGRLKEAEGWKKQNEDYQKQIEEIRNAGNSEFLSKPLIRQAFVAQQLLEKYPDKDPDALQKIVMADLGKMSDLDVLVKNQKIDLPNLSEDDIRAVLLDKYGIDPEVKPEEWSSISKAKLAIDAQGARANIKALTNGIELPKTVTKEERERVMAENLQKKIQATEPLKGKFTQFDKFRDERIPDLGDFDVPSDYKAGLGDMFHAMFMDAGLEATDENLGTAVEMRNALMVLQNLPKIWEIAVKHGQTSVQKKVDQDLNNTTQPNTTTASDDNANRDELPGPSLSAAFASNKL